MSITGLSKAKKSLPRYLKALCLSLVLTALSVVVLRWFGFETRPLADKTPRAFMLALAFMLPTFSLALDSRYFRAIINSIDSRDRLPLFLLLTAQVLWFYSFWLTTACLISYLVLVVGRFVLQWQRNKQNKGYLNKVRITIKQRVKVIPSYIWCLLALFFLNAVGLLWQSQTTFPNPTDKYILYVLFPMSFLLYKPKTKSVYQFVRIALPIALALLSIYLLYAILFHLVYFDDLWAWIQHPFSRVYQPKLFWGDTYLFYSDWFEAIHPSYILLALLPYFLISFFDKTRSLLSEKEEIVFVVLTSFFVLFTHLRYGLYYIVLMLILHLWKPYFGATKELFKKKGIYLFLGAGLLAGFLYQERDLFFDELRLELYQSAIEEIKTSPILGQGSGAEHILFQKSTTINEYHAHNLFLSMMVNFGIIGLLWAITFCATLFYEGIKRNQVLFAFFIFLLPMFIIESPFTFSSLILLMLMSFILISFLTPNSDSNYAT